MATTHVTTHATAQATKQSTTLATLRNSLIVLSLAFVTASAQAQVACPDLFSGHAITTADLALRPTELSKGSLKASKTAMGQVASFFRWLLSRRYDIEVTGLKEIAAKGDEKIVFLFEHPAFVDPVILMSETGDRFAPRPVVAASQNKGIAKFAFSKLKAFIVPEAGDGDRAAQIDQLNKDILTSLASGQNIALAPSGQLKRTHLDEIRGKSMAATIIQNLPPGARVVIVTNKGLWGSTLSYGHTGSEPNPLQMINGRALKGLIKGNLPRRSVQLGFEEVPQGLLAQMKTQDRTQINDFLESKINAVEQDNVFVPLVSSHGVSKLPDPIPENRRSSKEKAAIQAAAKEIPADFKSSVIQNIKALVPVESTEIDRLFNTEMNGSETSFGNELGLDSLGFAELVLKLEEKMHFTMDGVQDGTPAEVLFSMYKASLNEGKAPEKKRVDLRWFRYADNLNSTGIPAGDNVLEVLYKKARQNPEAPWMSDEKAGVMTYREAVSKIMVLSRVIGKMKGQNIGLMLPPSAGATLMYFATLEAGKTPTMINYTAGNEALKYSVDLVGTKTVITSKEFVTKLESKKLLTDSIADKFLFAEDLMKSLQERSWKNGWNLAMNLINSQRGRFEVLWNRARGGGSEKPAVILFTSGSSSNPKPVVLSHKNILTNVRDIAPLFNMKSNDAMMGFAPFFHSLGLTGTLVMPALLGVRANYFPDATDGHGIAQAIDSHHSSMVIGPPALLRQIFATASPEQLKSLRYVLAGAAELNKETADFLQSRAQNATIMEGAGATETSPVWAVSPPEDVRLGSVGKVLPSITAQIVDNDSLTQAIEKKDWSLIKMIPADQAGTRRGELVLSGNSVIEAYFNNLKPEAFFEMKGRKFYRTEDLVSIDKDGYVRIEGRFSRQHKTAGGEMINHQMLERQLGTLESLKPAADGKETFYIGAGKLPSGESVAVLVSSRPITVEQANAQIALKYSPTWFIKKVITVPEIPLLGTGKVDGRTCNDLIKSEMAKAI